MELEGRKHHHHSSSENIRVFASFRSTQDQDLSKGTRLSFNVVDTNVGNGIELSGSSDLFRVKVGGHYLINYGFNSVLETDFPGINLIVNKSGQDSTKDQIFNLSSSSIILPLHEGDTVRLESQANSNSLTFSRTLLSGTTLSTDTAYITFVKMLPKNL